ncbi:MAG TPA: lipopolysaccharide kinase InaA family protein [bacterium]|nr:lipopolysaccharide kinase InaA family protein [bacterium]HQO36384.1 lipopolysaccharide kinase InaA family protein [bacterium]HQP97207.1 lipopolysaccharide kinase InaA family protein [bacterium]
MPYSVHLINRDYPWLRDLRWENDPAGWVSAGAQVIKKSKSRFVFLWKGESPVFIKRYLSRRWTTQWLSWLVGVKSAREAKILLKLRGYGIPAPEPFGVVTPWTPLGQTANYLVLEPLRGQNLHALIRESPEKMERVAQKLGSLLAQMHAIGFFHHDANLHNFFLDESDETLYAIDVDGGWFPLRLLMYHRRRNVEQVLKSGRGCCTDKEWEARFCKAYAESAGIRLETIAAL